MSGRQPPEVACCTACISKDHSTFLPASSGAITWSQTCGLVHSNSFTVPTLVMVLSGSNMAKEWCARADPANKDAAIAATADTQSFMEGPPKAHDLANGLIIIVGEQ